MAFLLYVPAAVAQDTSPPLPGSVLDGPGADADWQNHTISLSANWSGFSDPQSGVAGYRWAIGTAPGTADILPFTDVGTATNAAVFGLTLAEGATYYVTVEAANPDGYSVTATSDGVRIDTIPPPVPSLVSPPDSSTESTSGGVSFSWSVAAGASTYRFQLSTSSGFASPLLADIVLATTNTTTAALPTDTYFWRVVATDAAGNSSPASTVYSFTTTGSSVGSLSAAIGPASPFPSNELRGAVNLPVLQLRLSASAAEDIQLTALTISAQGTLDDPLHIREVRVWLDADSNGTLDSAVDLLLGGPRTYLADQGSITFPALGLLLPAGQSRDVLVVYGLNDTSPLGATFSARVASATHVEARGVTSNQALVPQGTFPLDGPTITIVASGSPGGLTVRLGSRTPGDGFIAAGEQTVEMAQIHLAASSVEDVRITGLVVHATGTADDAAGAAAVYVARDADENGILNVGVDTLLGTGTYVLDDGALGISFSTPLVLPKGRSASLLVVYDLSSTPSVGETFSLDVKPSEVAADGVDSGAQVTPSGLDFSASVKTVGTAGTTPVTLQISGRTLARGEPLWPTSRDIPALAFDLKVGGLEGVGVQLLRLKASGTGNDASDVARAKLWEDLDADGDIGPADRLIADVVRPFSVDDGEATFTVFEALPAGALRRWLLSYDLDARAQPGAIYQVSLDPSALPAPVVANGDVSSLFASVSGLTAVGPPIEVRALAGSSGESGNGACAAGAGRGPSWAPALLGTALLMAALMRRGRP